MARQRIQHAELYTNIELLKSIVTYDETSPTFLKRIDRLAGKNVGSLLNTGYYHFSYRHEGVKTYYLNHRIVWTLHNGVIPEGMFIDHIDGNRSNNNISNLRLATNQQNSSNKFISNRIKATGLPSNIYCYKQKYYIRLMAAGVYYESKRVDTLDEALILRTEFKQKYFGDFATQEKYETQIC